MQPERLVLKSQPGANTMRTLITGAAGAGTTTLAKALAAAIAGVALDTDDFFWLRAEPPFDERRDPQLRRSLLLDALSAHERVVLSGCVMGWGAEIENEFDLVIFLYVETEIRLQRLRAREVARWDFIDDAFIEWARLYDSGPPEGRSLPKHNAWLAQRACRVIRLAGNTSVDENIARVEEYLRQSRMI